jgi:hypothetical protein
MENSTTFATIANNLKILIFLFNANTNHRTIKIIKMIQNMIVIMNSIIYLNRKDLKKQMIQN